MPENTPETRPFTATPATPPAYAVPANTVLESLETSSAGLTAIEAERRLAQYGPNLLPKATGPGPIIRFLRHFHNILIYVLIAAALVTAALGHFVDTGVILAVVIANATIGFIQEGRAERAMESIQAMLRVKAGVFRDGKRVSIDSQNLVPGDIVVLEAGDKVPADLRLFETNGTYIQESMLTGESVPVEKNTGSVDVDTALGDRVGMAYGGTLVTAGQARGVTVATGRESEIGRISGMLSGVETLTTPLVLQINIFAKWLTLLILTVAALLLVFGYFVSHQPFADMLMAVVGLSVAAIPEGLPAVLTITLAIGVQAMARRNAIVRRLPAIETLGSVSVICTDKTGTLTRNEMMVRSAVTRTSSYQVEGNGYAPEGSVTPLDSNADPAGMKALHELARAAALCNDAGIAEQDGVWHVNGDPMEGALLAFSAKVLGDHGAIADGRPRRNAIPFDSRHRFMATLHETPDGQGVIYVKGAPERLVEMCATERLPAGETRPVDRAYWLEMAETLAQDGQRVLALATGPAVAGASSLSPADLTGALTLVGLVGLIDPPRPEAIAAIADCREAGIRVKMITGDHPGTAAAIGRQIGIERPEGVMTGADLDRLDDAELARRIMGVDIFARTSPEHKLRLVMALQAHGLTVAMTGDGVNDAPALKRADAGIAMGLKGSEAAREAADIVLADDNFASIAAAVREGRTVYDNIKKVISWTLPTNGGEAMTIIVALLVGMPLPISPVQILWVNLVTAVTLGIVLAFEPTEPNTMRRPPRRRDEPLLGPELAWHIVLVSILFLAGVFGMFSYAVDRGYTPELARTIALNTLVVMEIFHLFFIRNIYGTSLNLKALAGTRLIWTTIAVLTAAQFAITYIPALQTIFGTQSVPLGDGLLIVAIGVVLFVILELEKQLRLTLQRANKRPAPS
ncbi:cation-transporting P-type ATPase [Aquisalinus flavus]|uniref:Carbonate dehydratase n=1 Tax=Aquisalinus flavus TaxID=1526572 RepID=A0A8J2Y6L1_9PROT|nr:cation-transporting P-type ATPase [Aquisalinus flavus]MBD0426027.1 cation-transporting P-type ATPase [Aquisalinus flavus]UNE48381.1 cation-transporting P-type ATPase [Aquisalinus flavus]GGD11304.1 carbonate dehydratase [Aquisalinus flavus]